MRLGYTTDDSGSQITCTTVIPTHIRDIDVELLVHVNRDISYPLQSPHNRGLHVDVRQLSGGSITDFNVNEVTGEAELIDAVNDFFDSEDKYVMISDAACGETFSYETEVYDQTAIDNKSYDCWDDDKENLEDNADHLVSVFLNNKLRWQVN